MSQGELNAKKIETLTKVARLLGDQIQAQSRAINKIQNEIDWIKESLKRIINEELPVKAEVFQTEDEITPETLQAQEPSVISFSEEEGDKTASKTKKLPSEKEELRQALKIIDNL
ncbi:hypothetical protein CEE45_00170 [Candidatus Heimdallarchaeota archaeon B3_Heim]|nr:MAG: hypothetical protein CEE45_00170 [Candidatus Heimdallarchaeota archaeon B3_Heim]